MRGAWGNIDPATGFEAESWLSPHLVVTLVRVCPAVRAPVSSLECYVHSSEAQSSIPITTKQRERGRRPRGGNREHDDLQLAIINSSNQMVRTSRGSRSKRNNSPGPVGVPHVRLGDRPRWRCFKASCINVLVSLFMSMISAYANTHIATTRYQTRNLKNRIRPFPSTGKNYIHRHSHKKKVIQHRTEDENENTTRHERNVGEGQ